MAPDAATPAAVTALVHALGAGGNAFLTQHEGRALAARDAAAELFAQLSASDAARGVALPLPGQLHTAGLDAEQVWMQIEMQMAPLLAKCKAALKHLKPAMEAGDDVAGDRLLRVPAARAGGGGGGGGGGGVAWEAFEEGADYDMADEEDLNDDDESSESDEEEDEDEDEGNGEEEGAGGGGAKKKGGRDTKDVTAKFFKNPGMFSLADMDDFAMDAEAEEEEEAEMSDAKAAKKRAGGDGGGSDDDDDEEEEEDPLFKASDSEDDSDSEAGGAQGTDESDGDDDDDGMAAMLGYSAKLVGAEAPARTKKGSKGAAAAAAAEAAKTKKKGKEIMFDDFFGGGGAAAGRGGAAGGRAAAPTDEDEISDQVCDTP
jgi:hypothetical protein